jgi:serine protease AprX
MNAPLLRRPLLAALLLALAISTAPAATVDPALAARLAEARSIDRLPVLVVMRDQLPLDALDAADGPALVPRLRALAAETQAPLLEAIASRKSTDRPERVRRLWIANVLALDATPALVRRLAARRDVAELRLNEPRPVFERRFVVPGPVEGPIREVEVDPLIGPTDEGVKVVGAPRAWLELGVRGEGVVVAVIDSGVCLEHEDIAGAIWRNPGEAQPGFENDGIDNDANGFVDDVYGWDFMDEDNDPTDIKWHGSHVAGLVAGDGTLLVRSGVAPGAQIMALRVGTTSADEMDVWRAIEYAVANGADVVNMSLGFPRPFRPDVATWRRVADTAAAMGVTLFAAAGNEGSGREPQNVRTPADVPSVIAVGATDVADELAPFSSTGPVTWADVPEYGDFPYPPGLVKPDLVAPGVDAVSHALCDLYFEVSGTSMATPRAAGVAALILSANPTLTPAQVREILESTAVDLGVPGRDNEHGAGRIDAYAAVRAALDYGQDAPARSAPRDDAPSEPTPSGQAFRARTR